MTREVILEKHDPAWADKFAAESGLIAEALAESCVAIHHIGSTAIPASVAKPLIDVLVVARSLAMIDSRTGEMESLGYEAHGEYGIAGRRYFRKFNASGIRTFHVHAFAEGDSHVDRHLAFRDFMNAHPEWARRYSDLKLSLAAEFPDSAEDYWRGKGDFIRHVDELAAKWRQSGK